MNSGLIFALIPLILSLGIVPAFAQMESIRITGIQYPEIDTFFNIKIIVEGTSRSSGGLFDIHGTIYEKDNPNWVVAQFVKDLYSGTNTVTIDMKKGDKPYKVDVPYIIEIQHVQIISKFEFTPVEKSSDAPVIPFSDAAEQTTKTNIAGYIQLATENWVSGQVSDALFVHVIEYFVEKSIISIPYAQAPEGNATVSIPSWFKTNAEFWVKGDISNYEFAKGLEWLINNGIIKLQQ